MNNIEKLTEATILALQGKLTEGSVADKYKVMVKEFNNCPNDFKEEKKIMDKYNISNYYERDDGTYLVTFYGVTPHIVLNKQGEFVRYIYPDEFPNEDEEELDESLDEYDDYGLPVLEKPYYISYYEDKDKAIIKSSHPYDLTEYSYAVAKLSDIMEAEDSITWVVYDYNKDSIPYKVGIVEGVEEAVELMKDLDSKKKPNIDKT